MRAAVYARFLLATLCLLAVATLCLLAVATLCLLAVATPASAECAWVLWVEESKGGIDIWKLEGATVTRARCVEAMTERLKISERHRYTKEKGGWVGADNFVNRYPPGDGTQQPVESLSYICLPDTIDPRGPKGK